MLRAACRDRGRIVRLSPDGTIQVLTATFHSACDPDVSFDGTRCLFAAKRTAEDDWNIYEMTVDGSRFRQITRSRGDCRSPRYQSSFYQISEEEPWYQILFVGSDPRGLNETGTAVATAIYSCKLDGSLVRRVTFNLSSDFDPSIMWDGRLLYSTWQRRTLQRGDRGRIVLLDANPEGTDYAPFATDCGLRIKHMACTTPDGLAVFVETDHSPWDGAGQLASVSLLRPLHTYRRLTEPADGLFHCPSPLPDGIILVSRRPADGSGTHAVYRLDPESKRMAIAYDDPQRHDIQATAITPHPEPDGRSSSVLDDDPTGKLYCLSIYNSDHQDRRFVPGMAKRLRVVEGLPRTATDREKPVGASLPEIARRRVLGEAPIAQDGSFNIEVPANVPLELHVLDEDGISLRSCGWVWTRNHFNQGCVGCHEDPELTPENRLAEALDRPTVRLLAPPEERPSVDFRRDVLPIVEAKCTGCHGSNGSPPVLAAGTKVDPEQAYLALRSLAEGSEAESAMGKYVHPGRARTSPLVWHMFGRNTSRPWDGNWRSRPATPIPPGESPPLTHPERETIVRWIDLGAAFEGIGLSAVKGRLGEAEGNGG